jgi:peptide/nickel transport system permease protein
VRARFARRFARRSGGMLALAYLAAVVGTAVLGPVLVGADPLAQDLRDVLAGPGPRHLLGTDEAGRDVLTRLVAGGRVDLAAGAVAALIAFGIGVPVGLLVGFAGDRVDAVAMRVVEAVQALPGIVVLTAVIAVVGRGVWGATLALGIAFSVLFAQTARTEVRSAKRALFVDSARTLGVPRLRIVLRHVLPHVLPTLLVTATTVLGTTLLVLAGLSLLGLGAQPPEPSWGAMLQSATQNMYQQFFAIVPPGVTLVTVVLACNVVADVARESLARMPERPRRRARGTALALSLPRRRDGSAAPAPPAGPPAPALEVRGLSVHATGAGGRPVPLVDGVDLVVAPGEILGLVGASGSGKTMTATAVAGLLPPGVAASADVVALDGQDLRTLHGAELRRSVAAGLGMVFQNPTGSLDPARPVGRQVGEVLRVHLGFARAEADARVRELLDGVGIPDPDRVARSYPHELSGGMAQRVMIASALAARPRLLIADEPTTALDVSVQAQVLDLLRGVRDGNGTGILFITHDLAVVADLCDRVAVMQAGRIVETAPVGELFARPRHPYTRELLAVARRDAGPTPVPLGVAGSGS